LALQLAGKALDGLVAPVVEEEEFEHGVAPPIGIMALSGKEEQGRDRCCGDMGLPSSVAAIGSDHSARMRLFFG
jgi:hypothetical protein